MTATVYRVRDAHGCLLYIGSTKSLDDRLAWHRRHAPWWPAAAQLTVTHYDSVTSARLIEAAAITVERPTFNKRTTRQDQRGLSVAALLETAQVAA